MKVFFVALLCLLGVLGARSMQPSFKHVKAPTCLPALALYLQAQENVLNKVEQRLQTTEKELQKAKQSIAVGKWPAGSYCILASGNCPAGFTRHSGHLRALNMYSHTPTYITPVTFGSSRIQCHGRCGQYGHWVGDLFITACCK